MDIICSVDKLKYQIMFINPAGEENGKCGAPFRVGKGIVFCNGTFNINQDLKTNTTTLIIEKSKLIYGRWKCYHGTHIGFGSLDIKMPGKYWQLRTNNVIQWPKEKGHTTIHKTSHIKLKIE